jgi:hypothetical protein
MVGASWYQAWIDGKWLLEGPFRYSLEAPEFQTEEIDLPTGDHVLAVHARHDGVTTRMLKTTPPYLWCRLLDKERDVPIAWEGLPLTLQSPNVSWMAAPPPRRINPQLGWSDHRDTRLEPENWREIVFENSAWKEPILGASDLPEPVTAIFATNPMTTLGIMRRAQERGILVPRDLSLVGVDDSDVRLHVWPRLSAVTQDASALGLEAAHWLTTVIARGDRETVCRRTIATAFEVNGTTAPPAAKGGRVVAPAMQRAEHDTQVPQAVEA